MTIYAFIPVIVFVVGWLLWAFKSKPNSVMLETGKIMFVCGLLVTLFVVAHYVVKLL